jgi:cold shock CspA family protein
MPLYGVVDNISKLKTQGFGFLKPEDGGKTIYFHING